MKTKNLFLMFAFLLLLVSCKDEEEDLNFNFEVAGINNITSSVGQTQIITLDVNCTNGKPEEVSLDLNEVPEGVVYSFENHKGMPNYKATLALIVTNEAKLGVYNITLEAVSGSLKKSTKFVLNVDDELSMVMTVYDASKWSYETLNGELSQGASVKLFKDHESFLSNSPFYSTITDETGRAYFYDIPYGNYMYVVEKGILSNIVKKTDYAGVKKGYVVVDIFRSNQEIMTSSQPQAKIGELRYRDINGDGKISDVDQAPYDLLSVGNHILVQKVVWIGN